MSVTQRFGRGTVCVFVFSEGKNAFVVGQLGTGVVFVEHAGTEPKVLPCGSACPSGGISARALARRVRPDPTPSGRSSRDVTDGRA